MKKLLYFTAFLTLSCGSSTHQNKGGQTSALKNGHWLFTFDLGSEILPFNGFYSNKEGKEIMVFKNGDEIITSEEITKVGDSLFVSLPVFGTEIKAQILSDTVLRGFWKNPSKSRDYKIPMEAHYGIETRFEDVNSEEAAFDFSGKWEVTFSPEEEKPCKAIGLFEQKGDILTGTFLTETGDYRFLEGKAYKNSMALSCFDGAHAFLFKAEISPEREMKGRFLSGNHYQTTWTALRNNDFHLTHPDSITHVVKNVPIQNIAFPDLNKNMVSLGDQKFKNKVIILQIMGTWCPNCADESRDFVKLHNKYRDQGLEIVAVAYEGCSNFDKGKERIESFKKEIGAEYTFLFAGKADKKENSNDFQMIDGITSYPTAIFIGRNGKIRKVHTGYYGPGTGPYYLRYQEETEMFVEKLLAEKVSN